MSSHIFVCPQCQGTLALVDAAYHCPACARAYPILDGIPDFYIPLANEEEEPAWRENRIWLDPQMADARDTIYRLSVPELKGMQFAMRQLAAWTFPGCRILEVGTGTGHITRWMAEVSVPGTEIFSFDFSWPMFAKARTNLANRAGITLLRANAIGKLPFHPESFDFVFLRLAPLGDPAGWNVQSAFDLLRPGGRLFKAGWDLRPEKTPFTQAAIQIGYESAELHQWHYPRTKTLDEYAASRLEAERASAFGAPFPRLPAEPASLVVMVEENLRIARKPL